MPEQSAISQLSSLPIYTNIGLRYIKVNDEVTLSNVRLSWKVVIPSNIYEQLTIESAGFECGIDRVDTSIKTLDCSNNIGINDNGDYYILASINIPKSEANTKINTSAYFTINGTKITLQQTSYSLQSAVSAYVNNDISLTPEQEEALNALITEYEIVL